MSNSVIVKFTKHGSQLSVKDLSAAATVDKEYQSKHAGKFMKKLMDDSSRFKAVHSKLNEAYLYHRTVTMPYLDNGMRMLNTALFDKYIEAMNKYKSEIQRLMLDLKPEWDNEIALDMQRLGGLANPKDYPSWGEIEYKYAIDVKFLPVPEKEDFRFDVDQSVKDELDNMKQQAKIEGRKEIYERVEKAVATAAANCCKDKPRIHETLLSNMADLADVMKYLNIHEDAEINVVAERLKELSESATTFNLRNDEVVRKQLGRDCDKFLSNLRNGTWYSIEEPMSDAEIDQILDTVEQHNNELAESVV